MAENARDQQLGKFVVLFQGLEHSLIEIITLIADENYVVETLPAETAYRRLVESSDVFFSRFVDLLRQPDAEAKARFHQLMEKCLDVGVVRDRLVHSTYALLENAGDAAAPAPATGKPELEGGSPREAVRDNPPLESFEPYFQQIAEVHSALESFRLQLIAWKDAVG